MPVCLVQRDIHKWQTWWIKYYRLGPIFFGGQFLDNLTEIHCCEDKDQSGRRGKVFVVCSRTGDSSNFWLGFWRIAVYVGLWWIAVSLRVQPICLLNSQCCQHVLQGGKTKFVICKSIANNLTCGKMSLKISSSISPSKKARSVKHSGSHMSRLTDIVPFWSEQL